MGQIVFLLININDKFLGIMQILVQTEPHSIYLQAMPLLIVLAWLFIPVYISAGVSTFVILLLNILFCYFHLFIVATCCPSERRPQKTVSCYRDSARIKDKTTENSAQLTT